MANKPKPDDFTSQLTSPGWRLIPTGIDPAIEGTLEDMARAAHERKHSGKDPGVVRRADNEIELELLDLQLLWRHLGLPT